MSISKKEANTFTLTAVGGTITIWDTAFNLGVYNTIFFDKTYIILAISLVVFFVSLVLPDKYAPIKWWERIILIFPTMWLGFVLLFDLSVVGELGAILILIGLLAVVLCLPYCFYVISKIMNPELFSLQSRRLRVALIVILLGITTIGYFVGANHQLFLTCEEFEISGNYIPDNCTSLASLDVFNE